MSDYEGRPARLKDRDGTPTGEWGAWVNDIDLGDLRIPDYKLAQVGRTVLVTPRSGEPREETIAEVLYVQIPDAGQGEPSMLVSFGDGPTTHSCGHRPGHRRARARTARRDEGAALRGQSSARHAGGAGGDADRLEAVEAGGRPSLLTQPNHGGMT